MKDLFKKKIQAKIENKLNTTNSNQYILMFHSVSKKEMWYDRNYCITPESFEHMILELKNRKVRFASIDKICRMSKKITAYFTFDDVFADVFTTAYPILKKYQIPFTVFVTVDFIDTTNMISRKMLAELSKDNMCVIGSHAFSHKSLSQCTIIELLKEIYGAKCTLEFLIRKKVEYLAYPYGNIVHVPMTAVIIAFFSKYKRAFSTVSAPVCNHMRYFTPRINVNECNWRHILNKFK